VGECRAVRGWLIWARAVQVLGRGRLGGRGPRACPPRRRGRPTSSALCRRFFASRHRGHEIGAQVPAAGGG
jgi:hypothetical protein